MSRTVFTTIIYGFHFYLETDYENIESMRKELEGTKYSIHDVIYHSSLDNTNEYIFGKELMEVSDGGYEVINIITNEQQERLSSLIFKNAEKIGINTQGKKCEMLLNLINI